MYDPDKYPELVIARLAAPIAAASLGRFKNEELSTERVEMTAKFAVAVAAQILQHAKKLTDDACSVL